MPVCRTVLALLLCISCCRGAAELRTLAGTSVTGDLVGISNKDITIKTAAAQVVTPLEQVVDLKLGDIHNPSQESKYTDVELTDGTLLHCTQFVIKGKEVELTLLGDQQVKVPLATISFIQKDANDEKTRSEWKERFFNRKRSHDLVVARIKPEGTAQEVLDAQEGTLGNADEEGKNIEFLTASGTKRMLSLSRIQGMIFQRSPDPNAAPVLCKFYDAQANQLMVSNLAWNDKGITVTTPAGATIDFPITLVARLDFSKGKLTYLSDDAFWKSDKVKVIQSSTEDRIEKPHRDKNLDDRSQSAWAACPMPAVWRCILAPRWNSPWTATTASSSRSSAWTTRSAAATAPRWSRSKATAASC